MFRFAACAWLLTALPLLALLPTSAAAADTAKYCTDTGDNFVVYVDKTTPYD